MSIKFIHTADVHFGIENYGYVDGKSGLHSRLIDFKKSFDCCIERAIEEDVDLFVFAGDAYKNSNPSPTHQRILLQCLQPLIKKNIPIIIVVGNHDHPGNFFKAHALDVFHFIKYEKCHIFSEIGQILLQTKNGPLQIVAVPWPIKSSLDRHSIKNFNDISENIKKKTKSQIKKISDSISSDIPSILIGHIFLEKGFLAGSEREFIVGKDPIFSISDLCHEKFDYIALGHLHKHQNLATETSCPIVYCGSPDRIDFGEKDDEKGFCLVEIKNKKNVKFNFIKIKTRNFFEIKLDFESEESMKDEIENYKKKIEINGAIIKIIYSTKENITIIPTFSFFQKSFSEAWYIADIQCINTKKSSRDRAIKICKEKSITDMIQEYCIKINEPTECIKKYIEIISEIETK
jgi:exonuclease SbcD